MINTDIQFILE